MKDRELWIDTARGIAIILVVIGHVVTSYWEAGLYISYVVYGFLKQFIYSFHMPLFMMISGFLCVKSQSTSRGLRIKKTLLSYGIPYIVFTILWVLMKAALSSVTNSQVSLWDIPDALFYPISFMWFLYALMLMKILSLLLEGWISGGRGRKTAHLVLSLIGYFYQPLLAKQASTIRFSDCILSGVLRHYPYFLLGMYCLPAVEAKLEDWRVIAVSGGILVLGNIYTYSYGSPMLLKLVIAIVGCASVFGMVRKLPKCPQLSILGQYTLPIYVLQGYAIAAIRTGLTKLHLNDSFGFFPMVICTAGGVVVPLLVYGITKRVWKLEALFYPSKYISIK